MQVRKPDAPISAKAPMPPKKAPEQRPIADSSRLTATWRKRASRSNCVISGVIQPSGRLATRSEEAAEEGTRAEADRRFLAVDRDMAKARVAVELRDQRGDPAVGQARHQGDAAIGRNVGDAARHFIHGVTHGPHYSGTEPLCRQKSP